MAYRQRNIPVTSKEEVQCQTDARLLDNHYFESEIQNVTESFARSTLRERGLSEAQSLLRPFNDNELLRDFHRCVKDMKDQPYNQDQFRKRLNIIEGQINGLLKRDYLVSSSFEGSEEWSSYYSALNEKEKDNIRLESEKIYSNLKVERLQNKIRALERQVEELRVSLVHSTQAVEENKMYSSFYDKLRQVINNGQRKGTDIEKLFEEQMLPVYNEFNYNLNAVTRLVNKETTVNTRPLVQSMAREFDRLLKEQQLTQEKQGDIVVSLLDNFKAVKGVDYMREQFEMAQRTETTEKNYKNMLSLFRHEIEALQSNHPHLKGAEKLDWLMRKLQDEGVDLVECKGWINLSTTSVRVHEVQGEDKKLRELLGVLAGQFRRVYTKFPELQKHCSSKLVQIFESEVLAELVAGASIERLKEIIVHEVQTVRVQDVYKYENSGDAKMILHLRVMIKKLMDELMRCRAKYEIEIDIDEAVLAMLKDQGLDLNIEEIIQCFRPPSRYIEVPIVIENKVYESHTYEKGVAINVEQPPEVVPEKTMEVVAINKEVPVFIERAVDCVITQQIPVEIKTEKILEVATNRDVIVDRIIETCREVPVEIEKVVPAYERQEVVTTVEVDKVVKDIEFREVERIVESQIQKIVEVETFIQKLVPLTEIRQIIREVEVKVPHIITKTEMIQIQKKIPYIIEKEQPIEVRVQVPIEIKVPELHYIELCEYRDKPIVTTNTVETPVYVELKVEKQLIKEVAKEIYIDRSHFIKGDKEEQIREVEVFVDKPIIQEVMITRDVQIQKLVPLYVREELPVVTEINKPYVSERVQVLEVEKEKIVNARREVIKTVNIDKPVPVVVERQIVKVQPQIIEKIVEKIIEVPRIVEVQKIVEKIVVVPRIVEKIVEVPKIIEKIVIVKQVELQIVEIQVPQIIIQEVEVPIEVEVVKTVVVKEKEVQLVDVEHLIEVKTTEEVPVQIYLEKRIPYEVIKEIPVETYRDRIEYQTVEIHETKVEPIEVQVPVIVQEKVPFVVEKEVRTHEVVKQLQYQKLTTEKEKAVVVNEEKLVVHEVIVEKPIIQREVVEVPGPETIVKLVEQHDVQVEREKVVQVEHYVQQIKEVTMERQRIIPIIHEKIISIPINELVTTPELIQVPKLVNLTHYKEVLVKEPAREQRMETTIVEQIKPVEQRIEVPTEVEITREKVREIVNDVKCIVESQTVKQIQKQVEILVPTETNYVDVPGRTVVQELRSENHKVDVEDRVYQKLVEKIVMLPQIVEIMKNIHHISEVNQLGVAIDVDLNVQVQKFAGVSTELRKGLIELLSVFKSNERRQPELKTLIGIIEKHMKLVDEWISFPKLIEIQKKVEVEVTKEKVVIVPSENKERESALSFMMEKMILELRRIKESHKISLNLDDDLQRLFFTERVFDQDMERRIVEMRESLRSRRGGMGDANVSGVNIQESLRNEAVLSSMQVTIHDLKEELDRLRHVLQATNQQSSTLKTVNCMMVDSNNQLLRTLQKHRQLIGQQQFESSVSVHRSFYDDMIEHKRSTLMSSKFQMSKFVTESKYVVQNVHESQITEYKQEYVGELVGKLTKYQTENRQIVNKSRMLESQVTRFSDELNVKNSIIKRLENDFESKLSRAREELSKNPNVGQEVIQENKKLLQKTRLLERQCASQKQNAERAKRQLDRAGDSQKRQAAREFQRKEREFKDSLERNRKEYDREMKSLSSEFEKVRRVKEKLESEITELRSKHSEEIKSIRSQQLGGATDKHNQLLNENMTLRKKYDGLEVEYEKLKKAAVDNNSTNDRETQKLKAEIERLQIEKRESHKKQKEGFLDLTGETQLINVKIELERKIKNMENDMSKLRNKDESSVSELRGLRERVKNLEIELEISRKELQASHKMKSTTFHSGYKSGVSSTDYMAEGARSPKGAYYKSAEEKRQFVSPESVQSEQRIEQLGSSSSRFSQQSGEERSLYKSPMSLRQFMQVKHGDDKQKDVYTTFVMIKIIEAVQRDAQNGVYNSYSPSNIVLIGFDSKHLDRLSVKFGNNIVNKNLKDQGLYLSPEVLNGSISTKKSVVFCLGVILDELIHGHLFFKSVDQIVNHQIEFKVRGEKLNPILKNTLFEMMNKEPSKRLELVEAKRRLSLQKYITAEGRSSVTVHQRIVRKKEEEK